MKRNMSSPDRVIRVILAALLAYLYFGGIVTGTVGVILLVLGLVFLVTSVMAYCPLYTLFNLSTVRS